MARVEIPPPADLTQDATGNVLAGRAVTAKLAGTATNATHYSALTGGTSTTGGLVTGTNGTIVDGSGNRRYVDSSVPLDVTIAGQSHQVEPVSATDISLIREAPINVMDDRYGGPAAAGDGTGNDGAIITAKLAALPANGGEVVIPERHSFRTTQSITISAGQRLVGGGGGMHLDTPTEAPSQIVAAYDGPVIQIVNGASKWALRGFAVIGDLTLASQDLLTINTTSYNHPGIVDDVGLSKAGRDGLKLNNTIDAEFQDLHVTHSKRNNIRAVGNVNGNNALDFTRLICRQSDQHGIWWERGSGVALFGGTIESNGLENNGQAVTATAAGDLFTKAAHGYAAGDLVVFTGLTGGAGITASIPYYVIAAGLTANDFQVSATSGGATIDVTSDLTAGTVTRLYSGIYVVGTDSTLFNMFGTYFENNDGALDIAPSLRTEQVSAFVQVNEFGTVYSAANLAPCRINGGYHQAYGVRTPITPHAVIGANAHAEFYGCSDNSGTPFQITDLSSTAIVMGGNATNRGITIGDIDLFRSAADILRLQDRFDIRRTASSDFILSAQQIATDTNARFLMTAAGSQSYGPGNATQDSSFGRGAANRLDVTTADLTLQTVGRGLRVKEGSNAKQGVSGAMTAGSVTVANTAITANSRLVLTRQAGGTNPGAVYESTRTAGTSFVITSTNAGDTGTVAYQIFEPA